MNHLKQWSSPQAVWLQLNAILSLLTLGTASIRPPPKVRQRLPKTSPALEGGGCLERDAGRAQLTSHLLHVCARFPPLWRSGKSQSSCLIGIVRRLQ